MTIDELKSLIQDILLSIPSFYRCYEITRVLKTKLASIGVDFKVSDGMVFYYISTFFKEAQQRNCKLYLRGDDIDEYVKAARLSMKIGESKFLAQETLYWRLAIRHSWGILPKEKLLVDCHRSINLSESSQTLLFQTFPRLNELEVKDLVRVLKIPKIPQGNWYQFGDAIFWEMAEQIGDEVHYPEIDYIVKLRCTEVYEIKRAFLKLDSAKQEVV